MRMTMCPPCEQAEAHANTNEKTLPRCILPEGEGAKRPITGAVKVCGLASCALIEIVELVACCSEGESICILRRTLWTLWEIV